MKNYYFLALITIGIIGSHFYVIGMDSLATSQKTSEFVQLARELGNTYQDSALTSKLLLQGRDLLKAMEPLDPLTIFKIKAHILSALKTNPHNLNLGLYHFTENFGDQVTNFPIKLLTILSTIDSRKDRKAAAILFAQSLFDNVTKQKKLATYAAENPKELENIITKIEDFYKRPIIHATPSTTHRSDFSTPSTDLNEY